MYVNFLQQRMNDDDSARKWEIHAPNYVSQTSIHQFIYQYCCTANIRCAFCVFPFTNAGWNDWILNFHRLFHVIFTIHF